MNWFSWALSGENDNTLRIFANEKTLLAEFKDEDYARYTKEEMECLVHKYLYEYGHLTPFWEHEREYIYKYNNVIGLLNVPMKLIDLYYEGLNHLFLKTQDEDHYIIDLGWLPEDVNGGLTLDSMVVIDYFDTDSAGFTIAYIKKYGGE